MSFDHQEQVSGLPRGFAIMLNGVRFDGCREQDGTMLEAKGPGYADKMTGPGDWKGWFTGDQSIEFQMRRQANAAGRRRVEWHFAEKPVADYFREFATDEKLVNVIVIYNSATTP